MKVMSIFYDGVEQENSIIQASACDSGCDFSVDCHTCDCDCYDSGGIRI